MRRLQQNLAYYAGTAEPSYGRSAISTVEDQRKLSNGPDFSPMTSEDENWLAPDESFVETKTFYFSADGQLGFAQIIVSNIGSWNKTAQCTFRMFDPKTKANNIWISENLNDFNLYGPAMIGSMIMLNLNSTLDEYEFEAMPNKDLHFNLKVKRTTPSVKVGSNGSTIYGVDQGKARGKVSHYFWPRVRYQGQIMISGNSINIDNWLGMYVHAIQIGKPQHLAKSWQFANFQGEGYSAIQMQFITPKSYDCTKVNVGIIAKDDDIVSVTVDNDVSVVSSSLDPETQWQEPKAIKYTWKTRDGEKAAELEVDNLGHRLERVDILQEIPSFLKGVVSTVAGTRPFIYQFGHHSELQVDNCRYPGHLFCESTFISD